MSTPKDQIVKHKIPRKTAEELAMEELDIAEALDEEENEDAAFWKADAKERLRIARINRELEAEEQRELRRWKRGIKKSVGKRKISLDKSADVL